MKKYLLGLAVLLFITSCREDILKFNPFDFTNDATLSAFVEVYYEDGSPAKDALVISGKVSAATDGSGMAYLQGIEMASSVYLIVDKNGYFPASRRFTPIVDEAQYIKIVLLSKRTIGQINSEDGGVLKVGADATLEFPPRALQYESGLTYIGTYSVRASSIKANDADLSYKMPGDLVGEALDGEIVALGSLGMVAVELRGENGEVLKVKSGEKVGLTIHVPAELQDNAPSTIPLWYFDEDAGMWKEEGEATLVSGSYVGNVSHFSYWNCDAWFPLIDLKASFYYESGLATNVEVCITILSLNSTRCAFVNNKGEVMGKVAAGERLLIQVYDKCGIEVYAEEVGPFSESTTISRAMPEGGLKVIDIIGKAVNCKGRPVTNGYATIKIGPLAYYAEVDRLDGSFQMHAAYCNESDVQIIIADEDEFRRSIVQTFDFSRELNAGIISACVADGNLIVIDVEEIGKFGFYEELARYQDGYTSIGGPDSLQNKVPNVQIGFVGGTEPGVYNAWLRLRLPKPGGGFIGLYGIEQRVSVTVSYYGEAGDYIVATISGALRELNTGTVGKEYQFSGTISVPRE